MALRVVSIQVAEFLSETSSRIYWWDLPTQLKLKDAEAMEFAEWLIAAQNKKGLHNEKRAVGVRLK